MKSPDILRILLYGFLGAGCALAYFSALGWNVRSYLAPGSGLSPVIVHAARILAVAVVLLFFARQGALALFSGVGGFQLMRAASIRMQLRSLESES